MPRPREKFDAWIVGEQVLPKFPSRLRVHVGEVLVHNVTQDRWYVLSRRAFNRQFEWAAG